MVSPNRWTPGSAGTPTIRPIPPRRQLPESCGQRNPEGPNHNERKITIMSTPTAPTNKATGWIVATIVAAGLALAGIVAALMVLFGPAAHARTATIVEEYPAAQSSASSQSFTPSSSGHSSHPNKPNPPVVRPSATIKLLQEQLGQLNYYNGPTTGYMNQATVQAIRYLQRDAHLPQTGQLNTATENALNAMLAGGNNQMGGNTNNNQMNANN
jgi:putative peptidoglycan binding protein